MRSRFLVLLWVFLGVSFLFCSHSLAVKDADVPANYKPQFIIIKPVANQTVQGVLKFALNISSPADEALVKFVQLIKANTEIEWAAEVFPLKNITAAKETTFYYFTYDTTNLPSGIYSLRITISLKTGTKTYFSEEKSVSIQIDNPNEFKVIKPENQGQYKGPIPFEIEPSPAIQHLEILLGDSSVHSWKWETAPPSQLTWTFDPFKLYGAGAIKMSSTYEFVVRSKTSLNFPWNEKPVTVSWKPPYSHDFDIVSPANGETVSGPMEIKFNHKVKENVFFKVNVTCEDGSGPGMFEEFGIQAGGTPLPDSLVFDTTSCKQITGDKAILIVGEALYYEPVVAGEDANLGTSLDGKYKYITTVKKSVMVKSGNYDLGDFEILSPLEGEPLRGVAKIKIKIPGDGANMVLKKEGMNLVFSENIEPGLTQFTLDTMPYEDSQYDFEINWILTFIDGGSYGVGQSKKVTWMIKNYGVKITSPPSGSPVEGLVNFTFDAGPKTDLVKVYAKSSNQEIPLGQISIKAGEKLPWDTTQFKNEPHTLRAFYFGTKKNHPVFDWMEDDQITLTPHNFDFEIVSPSDAEVLEGEETLKLKLSLTVDRLSIQYGSQEPKQFGGDTGKPAPSEFVIPTLEFENAQLPITVTSYYKNGEIAFQKSVTPEIHNFDFEIVSPLSDSTVKGKVPLVLALSPTVQKLGIQLGSEAEQIHDNFLPQQKQPGNISPLKALGFLKGSVQKPAEIESGSYGKPKKQYAVDWDTTAYPDGETSIKIRSYDLKDKVAFEKSVAVKIENVSFEVLEPKDGSVVQGKTEIFLKYGPKATTKLMAQFGKPQGGYDVQTWGGDGSPLPEKIDWDTPQHPNGPIAVILTLMDEKEQPVFSKKLGYEIQNPPEKAVSKQEDFDAHLKNIQINGKDAEAFRNHGIILTGKDLIGGHIVIHGDEESNVPLEAIEISVKEEEHRRWKAAKWTHSWEYKFKPEDGETYSIKIRAKAKDGQIKEGDETFHFAYQKKASSGEDKFEVKVLNMRINERPVEEFEWERVTLTAKDLKDGAIEITGDEKSTRLLKALEISLDGGTTWHSIEMKKPWTFKFKPRSGETYDVRWRATAEDGTQQRVPTERLRFGYSEEKIRGGDASDPWAVLQEMGRAYETEDFRGFMSFVSENFPHRGELEEFIRRDFRDYDGIKLNLFQGRTVDHPEGKSVEADWELRFLTTASSRNIQVTGKGLQFIFEEGNQGFKLRQMRGANPLFGARSPEIAVAAGVSSEVGRTLQKIEDEGRRPAKQAAFVLVSDEREARPQDIPVTFEILKAEAFYQDGGGEQVDFNAIQTDRPIKPQGTIRIVDNPKKIDFSGIKLEVVDSLSGNVATFTGIVEAGQTIVFRADQNFTFPAAMSGRSGTMTFTLDPEGKFTAIDERLKTMRERYAVV